LSQVEDRGFVCSRNNDPAASDLKFCDRFKKLNICDNCLFHVVPEAQLVGWEVLVLARTHNEEYVAVEVRLAEAQAAGDAFSADFNFA